MKYRITYDVVTPESAEQGDCAEHGFLGLCNIPYPLVDTDKEDREETLNMVRRGGFDRKGTLVDVLIEISERGMKDVGSCFSTDDPEKDLETGNETSYSLHILNKRASFAACYAINHKLIIKGLSDL